MEMGRKLNEKLFYYSSVEMGEEKELGVEFQS